jgi:hypothetical protein
MRRLQCLASFFIVESTSTRSYNPAGNQSSKATCNVNHGTSGKIQDTDPKQGILKINAQETIWTPNGMGNNWIDESREQERVVKIGVHLASVDKEHKHQHKQSSVETRYMCGRSAARGKEDACAVTYRSAKAPATIVAEAAEKAN